MAGNITAMLNSGFDAFQNLYDVNIEFPTASSMGVIDTNVVKVRCQDFTYTPLKVGTYTTDYLTSQLTKPNAKITGERAFSLTFRIDSAYEIYNRFLEWKRLYYDPSGETQITLGALGDAEAAAAFGIANDLYGYISVKGYQSNVGTTTEDVENLLDGPEWKFSQVMAIDVSTPNFTRAGSDPATFTVQFLYGMMKEPGTSL